MINIEVDDKQRCCGNCRFFFEEGTHRGQCRRYPPQAWAEPNPETTNPLGFNFPDMRVEEWCGEYQPKEFWVVQDALADLALNGDRSE